MLRIAIPLIVLAAPLLAQDKVLLCSVSAEIAGQAVAERAAGETQTDIIMAITAGLGDDRASFVGAVQPIVEWVHTLPEDQLTDEVAIAYENACLAQ